MNFFKINLPPTVSLAYKFSLTKDPSSRYKDHILTGSVEEVTEGFLWVADENTPFTSRFELIMSLTPHEILAAPNLDVVQIGNLLSPHLMRCFGNLLAGSKD